MLNSLQNGSCSFNFTTLIIHTTTLQSPPQTLSSTSVSFHLPIPPLFFKKNIHTSTLTLPSSIPQQSTIPSQQSTPKIFFLPQPFSQFILRQRTKELWILARSDTVLVSPVVLKLWTVKTGLTITDSLLPMLRKTFYWR